MKRIKMCLTALGLVLALAVTSCHKSADNVAAVVPSKSAAIVAINAELIIDNAGGKCDGNGIELPAALSKIVGEEDVAKLAEFKGVDLKNMYFFGEMSGNGALVAPVTDRVAITDYLKGLGLESEDVDGYTVFTQGRQSLLITDNIVWFMGMSAKNAVEYAEKTKKSAASDGSLADSDWRMDYFGKKHAVAALINLAQMPFISSQLQAAYNKAMPGAEMVEKWAKGTIAITNDLEGLTCTTSYSGFDENGKAIVIDPEKYGMTMKNIDADFLQYLTNDDVFVVAGGIPADYPWESILDAVSEQAGPQAAQVKMALPYLQALEGTFAIAAGPRNGIASFNSNAVNDNWSGVLYISLKEGKAAEFMGQIKMIVSQMMPDALVASDDDNLAVNLEGVTIYLGVRGNNLIASLQEIKGGGTASVFKASEFEGKNGIALLRLAKDSRLCTELGMPFGVFSKMCQSSDNAAEWLIEETSTEGKFLENIINYAVSLSGK